MAEVKRLKILPFYPEPQYQDYVKHKKNDTTGRVIALYLVNGENHIDVRLDNDHIWYNSPAKNWEKVRDNDE